jgi:hypothetical protein
MYPGFDMVIPVAPINGPTGSALGNELDSLPQSFLTFEALVNVINNFALPEI